MSDHDPASSEPTAAITATRPNRLLSLDMLRGLTVGFMILVNNPGSEIAAYSPLKHADWNGFTPTDLVFPTFLFLVGVTTVLSTASRLARGATRKSLFLHTLRRAAILFLLGVFLNGLPLFHLHTLRIYGVLPRIAICYFVVATLYLFDPGWRSKVAMLIAVLAGYWILMRFVPVPGWGMPVRDLPLLDRDGNLAAWLDRLIFSSSHLYEQTRDPEGVLSTLPALGTAIIGLLTGMWLRTGRMLKQKVRGILVAGVGGVLLGALWNFTFPINKKLWTSSYVLFAAGLSLLLLAVFIRLADFRNPAQTPHERSHRGPVYTALLVFGTNAITAYVVADLVSAILEIVRLLGAPNLQVLYFHAIQRAIHDAALDSLLYALTYVAVCWLVVYGLYRKRIFIKI